MSPPHQNSPRICVIDSINMDLIVRTSRFVRPGETIHAREWTTAPGGKGANQAVAAARLGAQVDFCGRIGADAFGAALRQNLIPEDVSVENLLPADRPTGVALISVDDAGQNAIYLVGGANLSIQPSDIQNLAPVIEAADFLIVQLEIPLEATLKAIEIARAAKVPCLLDPAPAPSSEFPPELLLVDLLSPNESEAEALIGMPLGDLKEAKQAALALQARGAQEVVIKLGERGAVAVDRGGKTWHVGAAKIPVVDTTAAGDAFSAALAISLAGKSDLLTATRFACAAGACAVGKPGAQSAMPAMVEVEAMLARHAFDAREL